jgi:hypothetical protein
MGLVNDFIRETPILKAKPGGCRAKRIGIVKLNPGAGGTKEEGIIPVG